jgi:hypothetical protein
MAWDDFGIYKLGPQTPKELHLLNVYKDPEFMSDIEDIFPKNKSILVNKYTMDLESQKDIPAGTEKVQFPDQKSFVKSLRLCNQVQKEQVLKLLEKIDDKHIKSLADKYAIAIQDIQFYLSGSNQTGNAFQGKYLSEGKVYRYSYHSWHNLPSNTENAYLVSIDENITKEDFMQIWKMIAEHKKRSFEGKVPKNKLPVYDKLLYAMFKARQQNKSFGQIFDDYSKGILSHYEKGARPISSEEKLKDYYYKYSPKPKN